MSARVRSTAHVTIVIAKIAMAIHIAHIVVFSMPKSLNTGAMSMPNVQNKPSMSDMSAALTNTASRKIYFGLAMGVALV